MPISEDEYDQRRACSSNPNGMSKAELRRSNKPIMEKRRRARINHCLNELKTLILDAMKKDPARHSKLEKADILEMTVKHLQTIQQRQQLTVQLAADPTVIHKFKTGFHECASEVTRFVSSMEGLDSGIKQRLISHLSNCVSGISQISPFSFSGLNTNLPESNSLNTNTILNIPFQNLSSNRESSSSVVLPQVSFQSGDVNNNNGESGRLQIPAGIQLIPSRLPTGELALLVPNSSNMPFFPAAATASLSNTIISPSLLPSHDTLSSKPTADSSSQYEQPGKSSSQMQPKLAHRSSAFKTVITQPKNTLYSHESPLASPASSTTRTEEIYLPETLKHETPSPPMQSQATSTPFIQNSIVYKPYNMELNASSSLRVDHEINQVTSTSVSPESSSDELQIVHQSVPIYQHSDKSRYHNTNKLSSFMVPLNEPLAILSADKCKSGNWSSPQSLSRSPLHSPSSITRKRNLIESGGLLSLADESTSKKRKYSSEVVSSSQSTSTYSSETSSINTTTSDTSENLSFESNSANTSNTSGSSGTNESMWRPW